MRGLHIMNKQYKKILSVLSAILVGVSIVFLAWRGGDATYTNNSEVNGNSKWSDSLKVIPQTYASKTLGVQKGSIDVSTTDATTTTDIIARRLLVEYVASQKGSATSTISDETAQAIANTLAQEVKLPEKKEYQLSDLNISSDNSREANILYINTVNGLTKEQLATPEKETDLTILATAVNTWSPATLNKLKPKIVIYQELIKRLLAIKTPSRVARIHLHLVQSFETLRSATIGLQSIVSDPVVGITALTEYRNWIDEITLVKQEYRGFYANY